VIDTTQLTQEQQWGLTYAMRLANETIEAENSNKPVEEQSPMLTESDYAEQILRGACDSYYSALLEAKKKMAWERVNAMTPEQQAALLAQLEVPDILPPE
jgi:hypothetical protein